MKIIYSIDEAQAKLQKRSKAIIEIAKPLPELTSQSMNNRQVSGQNKIWLIKFLRSVANDIHKGNLQIDIRPPVQNVSLFDAKQYVEKYIEQNSHF